MRASTQEAPWSWHDTPSYKPSLCDSLERSTISFSASTRLFSLLLLLPLCLRTQRRKHGKCSPRTRIFTTTPATTLSFPQFGPAEEQRTRRSSQRAGSRKLLWCCQPELVVGSRHAHGEGPACTICFPICPPLPAFWFLTHLPACSFDGIVSSSWLVDRLLTKGVSYIWAGRWFSHIWGEGGFLLVSDPDASSC